MRRAALWWGTLLVAGCYLDGAQEAGGSGQLFLSNRGTSIVARFEKASRAEGDIVPTVQIKGQLTRLSQPGYLTYDPENDRLYVANSGANSILIFDQVSEAAENVPPTRYFEGPSTQLNRPVQIEVDTQRDEIYVANAGSNLVTVYASASSLEGSAAPVRTIGGSASRLSGLSSLDIDFANNRLYLADPVGSSIAVFDNANTLNGNVPPRRLIGGANTRLAAPQYLLRDGDRLYVSCTNALLRFAAADTLEGNVAPEATVTGQTTALSRPQQLALDDENDTLYVADAGAGAVLVFANFSQATGSPSPLRKIQGSRTGFNEPAGLIFDPTPETETSTPSASASPTGSPTP